MTERVSARVLVIDERSRVLLVSSRDPDDDILVQYTPGGRVEDGEDLRTAALREIEEEAGIVLDDVTGPIWERRFPHTFDGRFVDGHEWFFVARVRASQIVDVNETDEGARYFEAGGGGRSKRSGRTAASSRQQRLAELLGPVLDGVLPATPMFTSE